MFFTYSFEYFILYDTKCSYFSYRLSLMTIGILYLQFMSGKELLYMITGTLNAKSGTEMYITDDKKLQNISVRSGQYLYLSVHDCWIPVFIRFSPEIGDWIFQNLENINVNGQKVMIKS